MPREPRMDLEPRPGQRLERLVLRAEDVEVAQHDHVLRPRLLPLDGRGQVFGKGLDLRYPLRLVRRVVPEIRVRRAHGELEPGGTEPDNEWRPRVLERRSLLVDRRHHHLAGESAEPHLACVVDERHPFDVPLTSFRHVRQQVLPPAPQDVHDFFERRQILADLLHGDDVEVIDDLGDVVERLALTRAVLRRFELADVPCGKQQPAGTDAFGDTLLLEGLLQPQETGGGPLRMLLGERLAVTMELVIEGHDRRCYIGSETRLPDVSSLHGEP